MKQKLLALAVAAAFGCAQARGLAPNTILDKLLQFDPGPTLLTVTAPSTNVLDMVNQRDMAIGTAWEGPVAVITVIVALTSAGATTLQIQLQGSVDNAAWVTFSQTDPIPKANLAAGTVIKLPMGFQQPQSAGIPRYYRLNYVVATGPFTGGSIEADLTFLAYQANNPPTYPPGVVVSN